MLSAVPVHWDHDGAGPLPGILLMISFLLGSSGTEHYRLWGT